MDIVGIYIYIYISGDISGDMMGNIKKDTDITNENRYSISWDVVFFSPPAR